LRAPRGWRFDLPLVHALLTLELALDTGDLSCRECKLHLGHVVFPDSWMTRYPETETQRTPLATAAAGMRQRDAAGMAGFLRRCSTYVQFSFLSQLVFRSGAALL
jgi:hypothetical protein